MTGNKEMLPPEQQQQQQPLPPPSYDDVLEEDATLLMDAMQTHLHLEETKEQRIPKPSKTQSPIQCINGSGSTTTKREGL